MAIDHPIELHIKVHAFDEGFIENYQRMIQLSMMLRYIQP